MRINKMITKRKILIFYQILSTNSSRKCMEISLENLYVDIGTVDILSYGYSIISVDILSYLWICGYSII